MKTFILLLSALLLALPAPAQILSKLPKAVSLSKIEPAVSRALNAAARNAKAFNTGLSSSWTKQILNQRFQFQREYKDALALHQYIQNFRPISRNVLRRQIQSTVINNTLRTSLLNHLNEEYFTGMEQELEQYFDLNSQFPFFSASRSPNEAFAHSVNEYLNTHLHKAPWQLREPLQFGGMRAIQLQISRHSETASPLEVAAKNGLNEAEAKRLFALYKQAEPLNKTIKEYIAKKTHTKQENKAFLTALSDLRQLYDELISFAKNSSSVRGTVEIYNNLLQEMNTFIAKNHRAPLWKNEDERALFLRFEPLVLANQANMFEEIVPTLTKLYEITEMYPVQRLPEADCLKYVQEFVQKQGFLPRSVKIRDFFDTRKDEPMLFEAMTYWESNSAGFRSKIQRLRTPGEDNFPQFY